MTREEFKTELECNLPDNRKKIWIWGTGHTTELYIQGLKRLKSMTICGFCDNNSEKWGGKKSEWIIVEPETLYKQENILVLISSWQKNVCDIIKQQLDKHSIESMPIDEFIFKKYRYQVLECYDSLCDQESKDVFAHIVTQRMRVQMPNENYISKNQYFLLCPRQRYEKSVFVDCGAYTGDTIETFIWNIPSFEKIYGFEPDTTNFGALKKRCDRLKKELNIDADKIELHNVAVGAEKGMLGFTATASISSVISQDQCGTEVIQVVTLDDILQEKYTFLKADVESFEYDMLVGAENSIKKWKPNLAICIYHNAVDVFSILLLLREMVPEYKFAVRHHSITFDETVLYAWT